MLLNHHNLDVLDFASTFKERPILTGVYVTPTHTVATDGYMLVEVAAPEIEQKDIPFDLTGEADPVILPPEAVKKALRNVPRKHALPILRHVGLKTDGRSTTLTTCDVGTTDRVECLSIEGKYPDYEQILPQGEPAARIRVNAGYLRQLADYFSTHAENKYVDIEIYAHDKPMILRGTTQEKQTIRGVLMPLRNPQ